MTAKLEIVRTMKSWEEAATRESDGGRKIARARVVYEWSGGARGESVLDYSMAYLGGAKALFLGFELAQLEAGERKGSLVLRHEGSFENGAVGITVEIVAGSGSGELEGVSGKGRIQSDPSDPMKSVLALTLSF